ncbi:Putative phytosulfokines 6 [Apostasia shenzhenica]|uniref:Phytosulfokine n=1 Tax=Apostasia shenzhenica TaxID=1088818 RepID=A0A2H9ZW70_9ASPA|nr:Putative phytosulfokines 6 [Apostasia shenzhenica]
MKFTLQYMNPPSFSTARSASPLHSAAAMKQRFLFVLLGVLSLLVSSIFLMAADSGKEGQQAAPGEKPDFAGDQAVISGEKEWGFDLLGCDEEGDDLGECLKRRMASEAHLDYIYTQELNP